MKLLNHLIASIFCTLAIASVVYAITYQTLTFILPLFKN